MDELDEHNEEDIRPQEKKEVADNSAQEEKRKRIAWSVGVGVRILTAASIFIGLGVYLGQSMSGGERAKLQRELYQAIDSLHFHKSKAQLASDTIARLKARFDTLNTAYLSILEKRHSSVDSLPAISPVISQDYKDFSLTQINVGIDSNRNHHTDKEKNKKSNLTTGKENEQFVPPSLQSGYVKLASYDTSTGEFFGLSMEPRNVLSESELNDLTGRISLVSGSLLFADKPTKPNDEFNFSPKKIEIIASNIMVDIKSRVYKIEQNGIVQFWAEISK